MLDVLILLQDTQDKVLFPTTNGWYYGLGALALVIVGVVVFMRVTNRIGPNSYKRDTRK